MKSKVEDKFQICDNWTPPSLGLIKINVDRSWDLNTHEVLQG